MTVLSAPPCDTGSVRDTFKWKKKPHPKRQLIGSPASEETQRQNKGKLHFSGWVIASKVTSAAAAANRTLSLKIKPPAVPLGQPVSSKKLWFCRTFAVQKLAQKNGASGRSPKTPLFTQYRRWDSNPHEVALTGF